MYVVVCPLASSRFDQAERVCFLGRGLRQYLFLPTVLCLFDSPFVPQWRCSMSLFSSRSISRWPSLGCCIFLSQTQPSPLVNCLLPSPPTVLPTSRVASLPASAGAPAFVKPSSIHASALSSSFSSPSSSSSTSPSSPSSSVPQAALYQVGSALDAAASHRVSGAD